MITRVHLKWINCHFLFDIGFAFAKFKFQIIGHLARVRYTCSNGKIFQNLRFPKAQQWKILQNSDVIKHLTVFSMLGEVKFLYF